MTARGTLGLHVLATALVLGATADGLLRGIPWGIALVLWVLQLALAIVVLLRQRDHGPSAEQRWLIGAAVLCAASWAWRDSPALNVLAFAGLLLALALLGWSAVRRTASIRATELRHYVGSCVESGINAMFGAIPLVLMDVHFRDVARGSRARHLLAIGRGLLIAVPLLLVFGGLLRAADAAFDSLAGTLLRVDMGLVAGHLAMTGVFAWISAGYLRGAVIANDPLIPKVPPIGRLTLGGIEIGLALGLVNLLFLAFVVVQVGYLFGGASHVVHTEGLTVAEYARRGFFELTAVSGLVLPLLLTAHAVLRNEDAAQRRLFRIMATTMVVLLAAIMASALARMQLYTTVFGLTEQRLYATACMVWLALVFAWFSFTVLRGRPKRFAFGALVAAYGTVGALHVINPDALIVRTNIARAVDGRPFDADYVRTLSADAVPPLVRAMPAMPIRLRADVSMMLDSRYAALMTSDRDWRTWSWARARARGALGQPRPF